MLPPQFENEESAVVESRTRVKKPPLFKVLLHNDDFTTMEFVVHVLESVFNLSEDEAVHIMLHVHQRGVGVAGTYTYEVAEMKVAMTTTMARAHEYPLLCTMEEEYLRKDAARRPMDRLPA
jgi:ATP-dependent Clp protease adaptor protein ClpS